MKSFFNDNPAITMYLFGSLVGNVLLDIIINRGNFSWIMFLFTTAMTTSWIVIGWLLVKLCFWINKYNNKEKTFNF